MISIIAAIGRNRELGKNNKLLWHIPEDFKRFKDLTSGHVVIMGRKTYESLPEKFRPLPNRINIIVTRDSKVTILERSHQDSNLKVIVCSSIENAIKKGASFVPTNGTWASRGEIFIIGGASIYQQGIQYADKLYLTLVDREYPDADAFFPDYSEFKKIVFEENHSSNKIQFRFIELTK